MDESFDQLFGGPDRYLQVLLYQKILAYRVPIPPDQLAMMEAAARAVLGLEPFPTAPIRQPRYRQPRQPRQPVSTWHPANPQAYQELVERGRPKFLGVIDKSTPFLDRGIAAHQARLEGLSLSATGAIMCFSRERIRQLLIKADAALDRHNQRKEKMIARCMHAAGITRRQLPEPRDLSSEDFINDVWTPEDQYREFLVPHLE